MSKGSASAGGGGVSFVRGETQSRAVEETRTANPDEIDIDDDDDDDDDDDENGPSEGGEADEGKKKSVGGVEKQAIPSQVFGGLKKDDDDD